MPIVIAQPSPVGAAAAGGRADARLQRDALDQRERLALAEMYQRSAIANAQIAEQGAGRFSDMNALGMQLESRNYAEGQETFRNQERIAGSERETQSRIQGQMMLQEQELSQSERLRLQRMKAARTEVASADWLTAEQKQAYDLEIATGINQMEQRNAAATVRAKEMQINEMKEASGLNSMLRSTDATMQAQAMDRMAVKNPDGSLAGWVIPKGVDFTPAATPKPEKPIDPGVQLHDLRKRAEDTVMKTMPKGQDGDIDVGEFNRRVQSQLELYENEQKAARARSVGGSQQPAGDRQPTPADHAELAKAEMTNRPDLPWEVKMAAANAIEDAKRLLESVGWDVAKLKGPDREKYEKLKNFVRSLPPAPAQQQPAPPAAAPQSPLPEKIANPPVHFMS